MCEESGSEETKAAILAMSMSRHNSILGL